MTTSTFACDEQKFATVYLYHFEIQFVSYTSASTLRVEKQKGSNGIE